MKRVSAFLFLIILSPLVLGPAALGLQEQTESSRKIVNRVMPQYPEMARTMNLRGSVKAEALVQPNGAVKSVDVKGDLGSLCSSVSSSVW